MLLPSSRLGFYLVILSLAMASEAQSGPLAACTVNSVTPYTGQVGQPAGTCPGNFFNATGTNPSFCYSALMHCANTTTTPDLSFIFSYDKPTSVPQILGSVVFFAGEGGTLARLDVEHQFAQYYFTNGYEVVQLAWTSSWEQTSDQLGILAAAARPAGFMNYVLNSSLLNARIANPTAGLCAQGQSAGAGAIGYLLSWYGDTSSNYLSDDLDNVELTAGPPFSRIDLGCKVTAGQNSPIVPVCYSPQYVALVERHHGRTTLPTSMAGRRVSGTGPTTRAAPPALRPPPHRTSVGWT